MTNPKHTPGPWEALGCAVSGPFSPKSHGKIGIIVDAKSSGNMVTAHANARLIAAAPELLEACKLALGAFERNDAIDWSILERAITKAEEPQ